MDHHTSKFTQGLNMPVLAVIATVGFLVVWVTVVGTQAYYEGGVRLEEQKKVIEPNYQAVDERVATMLAEQHAHVAGEAMEPAKRAVIDAYRGQTAPKPRAVPEHAESPGHH